MANISAANDVHAAITAAGMVASLPLTGAGLLTPVKALISAGDITET